MDESARDESRMGVIHQLCGFQSQTDLRVTFVSSLGSPSTVVRSIKL